MQWFRGVALGLAVVGAAYALPEAPNVVHGSVRIQGQGTGLQIDQLSPNAIIDWRSFSIAPQEVVRFLQPGGNAAILNRVVGADPSLLQGLLQANGRVFLVNPNGILFGPGAVVDAGSFVASTLSLSNEDFLSNKMRFTQDPGHALAAIVNQGTLKVGEGGFLVLASPLIHNDGLIVAQSGQVTLAASRQSTLSFDGQGLLQVAVGGGFGQASQGAKGTVLVTREQMSDVLTRVVNQEGLLEAGSLGPRTEGLLVNTGTIQNPGGTVRLDSSQATVVPSTGRVDVSAARGGSIYALSGERTVVAGQLDAHGSSRGGFVEVSAPKIALVSAPNVQGAQPGQVLLDPDNLFIDGAAGSNFNSFLPSLNFADGSGDGFVTIAALQAVTTGTITLEAGNITWNSGGTLLSLAPGVNFNLTATQNILMDGSRNLQASGNLQFRANGSMQLGNVTTTGTVTVNNPGGGLVMTRPITGGSGITIDVRDTLVGPNPTTGQDLNADGHPIHIGAANILGDPGNNGELELGHPSRVDLNITGGNVLAGPPSAARINGTYADGNVTLTPLSGGDVYSKGLLVTRTNPPDVVLNFNVITLPNGEVIYLSDLEDEVFRATKVQLMQEDGLEEDRRSKYQLHHRNRGLLGFDYFSVFSPTLHTALDTLGDPDPHFWRQFLQNFIIWEDEE